ncbi:MAG: hypothetical protein K1000chlam3_01651, partial [Chlamydiae bacterium]|nr:hypothetical protein [Chlamydiota bacterium]
MVTILSEFERLSKPTVETSIFNDEKLKQIASTTKRSEGKVAKVIARYLLRNFSIGPSFLNQSEKLKDAYEEIKERHLQVIDALLKEENVASSLKMQKYLNQFCFLCSKETIIDQEKNSAILSHDEVRSFPNIYGISHIEILPKDVNAKTLFAAIDKTDSIPKGMEAFFYKHVALYREGKILTWKDLAKEWGQKVQSSPGLDNLIKELPFSWLRQLAIVPIGEPQSVSFQAFVYEETIKVLENLLKV